MDASSGDRGTAFPAVPLVVYLTGGCPRRIRFSMIPAMAAFCSGVVRVGAICSAMRAICTGHGLDFLLQPGHLGVHAEVGRPGHEDGQKGQGQSGPGGPGGFPLHGLGVVGGLAHIVSV